MGRHVEGVGGVRSTSTPAVKPMQRYVDQEFHDVIILNGRDPWK